MSDSNIFSELGDAVGDLVHDKQRAYGDSFGRSGECLRQMFPEGINTDQYDDLLTIARILDKLFRLANDPSAFDENPYRDIVGYALLGMNRHLGQSSEELPTLEKLESFSESQLA
jgi:hypothetical protein|tara:strand:- start:270 stop:614 length:345 start_codon:yes stop_codon:yes gene_type:complete